MRRAGALARWRTLLGKSLAANLLPADLLDDTIPIERSRALFARYVDEVEIENHDFCNRVCWFCPNAFIDRRSALRRMPDAVFERIVADLAEIDYAGTLSWSRFHEAMADDSVFGRVAAARRALPRARLLMISNGDYMRRGTLARLEAAGLDRLMLDLYLPDGKEGDPGALEKGLGQFRRRTGLALEPGHERAYLVAGSSLKVTLDVPHYRPEAISTRGGLLDLPKGATYRRRAVCLAPVRHVVIDWSGKGMLCCQTRSDAPEHAGAVIGDLAGPGYGLFHFYRDLGAARRALVAPGEKGGVCLTCDVRDDGPDRLARRPRIAALLARVPGSERAAGWLWRRTRRGRHAPPARASRRTGSRGADQLPGAS